MNRFYKLGGQWLARVDGNPVLTATESKQHCESEYGVSGIAVLDAEDDPRPSDSNTWLFPPPVPPSPPTRNQALKSDLQSATTIIAIKDALLRWLG